MKKVKKAIIPAAGMGTRFLPATLAVPKEMLPIVDKPVIQYVVEEAIDSGIEEVLIIVSKHKEAIKKHFFPSNEIFEFIKGKGKLDLIDSILRIQEKAKITFVEQKEQKGLADAIYQSKDFVKDDSFAVLSGDTIIDSNSNTPCLSDLADVFIETGKATFAIQYIEKEEDVERFGIVDIDESKKMIIGGVTYYDVNDLVEKPKPKDAPSRYGIASRYVFSSGIFDLIKSTKPGAGNELQITDTMSFLAQKNELVCSPINGTWYDIGNPGEYIKVNNIFLEKK